MKKIAEDVIVEFSLNYEPTGNELMIDSIWKDDKEYLLVEGPERTFLNRERVDWISYRPQVGEGEII